MDAGMIGTQLFIRVYQDDLGGIYRIPEELFSGLEFDRKGRIKAKSKYYVWFQQWLRLQGEYEKEQWELLVEESQHD